MRSWLCLSRTQCRLIFVQRSHEFLAGAKSQLLRFANTYLPVLWPAKYLCDRLSRKALAIWLTFRRLPRLPGVVIMGPYDFGDDYS